MQANGKSHRVPDGAPVHYERHELHAFLVSGIVAHGFLRLRCGDCPFVEIAAPSDKVLQALLHKIIARLDVAADPPRVAD